MGSTFARLCRCVPAQMHEWKAPIVSRNLSFRMARRQCYITLTVASVICYAALISTLCAAEDPEFCPATKSASVEGCNKAPPRPRYILYDVNPPEGFNLRRDVYMRLAVFVRNMQKFGDWRLVLPPWGMLYHWQSANVGEQILFPWSMFFDVGSMQKFAPVIEMGDFLARAPRSGSAVNEVYILQHYKDMWEEGRDWTDRWAIQQCNEESPYTRMGRVYRGPFWGYKNITANKVVCLSFQGHAALLKGVLENTTSQSVMFDHAEVALHDVYGERQYWEARRSMRFSPKLVKIAADFRKIYLSSEDRRDGTIRPVDWRDEKELSNTKGGPYLAVHLRRKDFLWGRSKEVPDLKYAAKQLEDLLEEHKLNTVFVATDAPKSEFAELKSYLSNFKVLRFEPSNAMKYEIKDGGIAIVDQIICSHAKYFTGTHESTFSFRIQEEREIMGFNKDMTFNRLCGAGEGKPCSQPTRWQIMF